MKSGKMIAAIGALAAVASPAMAAEVAKLRRAIAALVAVELALPGDDVRVVIKRKEEALAALLAKAGTTKDGSF